jgi:hypothetical protein
MLDGRKLPGFLIAMIPGVFHNRAAAARAWGVRLGA